MTAHMAMTRDLGWLLVGIVAWVVWLLLWLPMTAWRRLRTDIPVTATAQGG